MLNYTDTSPFIISSSNNIKYSKNSGGLSEAAVASIVIACVVTLTVASIVAVMLRKSKEETENTTIIG